MKMNLQFIKYDFVSCKLKVCYRQPRRKQIFGKLNWGIQYLHMEGTKGDKMVVIY